VTTRGSQLPADRMDMPQTMAHAEPDKGLFQAVEV
jgi:hypothetical protein